MPVKALSFPTDLSRQRWLVLALTLIFAVISVQYILKINHSRRDTSSAFRRWSAQLHELDAGENIWARYLYPNPPIMALILKPFAALPPLAGAIAWLYFKILLTVAAIFWLLSLLDTPERPFPLWGKAVAIGLSLKPIEGDLVHNNVNLFILFLVVACVTAYCRRRNVLAGLLLALAVACKVTPALLVPYFVWKRAWGTLLGTIAGLVLFIWLVPGLALGFDKNQEYLRSWWDNMVVPYAVEGKVTTEHQNQSLPGLLHRLLTPSASFSTYVENQYVVLEEDNILALDPRLVRWLVKGCMGLFALLVLGCCRTPTEPRPSWRLLAEFSIIALGMLLFSERTWKHHCVTLLLPFAVLTYCWSSGLVRGGMRVYVVGSLTAALVLMMVTSTGLFDQQERLAKTAEVYGVYVWAHMILLACLAVLLGTRDETRAAA